MMLARLGVSRPYRALKANNDVNFNCFREHAAASPSRTCVLHHIMLALYSFLSQKLKFGASLGSISLQ